MRIGIDCDGVLRDLITCITDSVKETHPQHADKILESTSWDWEQWLPFWSDDEVLQTLAICGMQYYQELREEFK